MEKLKCENGIFDGLKVGDVIAIGRSLELVTKITPGYTFSSAPFFEESEYPNEPYRRSSHWVRFVDEGDEIIVFDNINEAIKLLLSENEELRKYYKIESDATT